MTNMLPADPDDYRGEPEPAPTSRGSLWSYALWAAIACAVAVLITAKPWAYWLVALGSVGVIAAVHLAWVVRRRVKGSPG
ncbi:hypothetical protein ACFRCR_16590 [Oerskovia sp. NPDC056781]|uniref:hypothetical protein n=1 Tax=Oerskovia sp. NPDC056781 TaxID=3345942 RepID=UPI00366ABAD9